MPKALKEFKNSFWNAPRNFFNAEGVGNIHVGHADVFVVGVFPHDRRHVGGHFAEPVEVIPGKEKFGFAPFLLQRAHHEITRGRYL